MFDLEQARKDGNLARGLVWCGPNQFRWRTVSLLNGPNQHGQYQVMCVKDGWWATTDKLVNCNEEQLAKALGFELAD
jgi:hypothetical protein